MAYDSTVPAAGSSLGVSRAPILENFVQIESAFNIDHVNLNAAGQGKHLSVTLPEGAAVTTAASEGAVYTKNTNGRPTLFYRQESDGTEIQMTGPDPVLAAKGKTFLPGGLALQWGVLTGASGSETFHTAFTTLYSITFGSLPSVAVGYIDGSLTTSGFNWARPNSGAGSKHYYMAIGAI